MFNTKICSLSLVVAGFLCCTPAFAADAALPDFRAIEYGDAPADKVAQLRADLAAHIPQGTSVTDAQMLLRNAGAHCASADGHLLCHYGSVQTDNEAAQDVRWTVDVQAADAKVVSISVTRIPAAD